MQRDRKSNCKSARNVKRITKNLPFMTLAQAQWICEIIQGNNIAQILEIGFFHGVSTCYFAAAIAPVCGHVTAIDIPFSAGLKPTAEELLSLCGLDSLVTIVREPAGAAWHMMKLIEERKQYDFCYIDDAHSWNITGLHFFLAEQLLKPGGYLLFDDLKWTVANSRTGNVTGINLTYEQKHTAQVGKVWELLVKNHRDLCNFQTMGEFGLCQKKLRAVIESKHAPLPQ